MTTVVLRAPLSGWLMPLSQVCDEVFAGGLAGEGVAIDPTGHVLHAPCDGEVVLMGQARHALSLRARGGLELLMHVGIDTVRMNGTGFELLVRAGQRVTTGEPLLRFDLDRIAREARSAVTPILISAGGRLIAPTVDREIAVGEALMSVDGADEVVASEAAESTEVRAFFRVGFDHGLHARPVARLVAAIKPFAAEVVIHAHGRTGNGRSAVALMALGARQGDEVEVVARGHDAAAVLQALSSLLLPVTRASETLRSPVLSTPRVSLEVPQQAHGVIAVSGLAVGEAVPLDEPERELVETATDAAAESAALADALSRTLAHLRERAATTRGAQSELMQAHAELLADPELVEQARARIATGASAAYAWRQSVRAGIEALQALDNAHLGERAADLRDLERQVLRALAGEPLTQARALPEHAILIAEELLPSQLIALDGARIAGICMARGGPTSHVALLAAARGIPTLVAAGEGVLAITAGTVLVLDAESGVIAIDPPVSEREAARERLVRRTRDEAAALAHAREPATTRDGTRIAVRANIGGASEAARAVEQGAEGCGLLRTEFLFLDRRLPPDEAEQTREYRAIAEAFAPHPLTLRTLDVGGDKPLAYLPLAREENPVLGVRGLRVGLHWPDVLRAQLRAALRASEGKTLKIMLPMVTDVGDLRAAREHLRACADELGLRELPALGVMIETPSSAVLADQLAREADFLSIGSNDLSQYVLAMDRGHAALAARLDALHPAVLRLIEIVARAGNVAGKPVAVCGGLGSDSAAIPLLIGLGVREVSAVPRRVPRIKQVVRALDARACADWAREALTLESAEAVRAFIAAKLSTSSASTVDGGG